MRHKGRELEMGRRRKEKERERVIMGGGEVGRERGDLDNVIPPSQETAQTISKNVTAQWSRRGEQHRDKP